MKYQAFTFDFMSFAMRRFWFGCALLVLFMAVIGYIAFFSSPGGYPSRALVHIPEGATIQKAGEILKSENAVRSVSTFSILAHFMNPSGGVLAGTYSLHAGENVISLAYRMAKGVSGIKAIKVTIPEGLTSREIGILLKERLEDFDEELFATLGKENEGYLFPDTYYLLPGTPPEAVIETMRSTFEERIIELIPDIEAFGKPLPDVITMASIVEREARKTQTRQIIAGILWKRIGRDIPLQVDAVFGYIFSRETYSPSFADLEVDSPYNTYKNLGLPPGPISNPGLDAIRASVTPTATPYLYYLTGADGIMRYARTFEEHVANRRFLR